LSLEQLYPLSISFRAAGPAVHGLVRAAAVVEFGEARAMTIDYQW